MAANRIAVSPTCEHDLGMPSSKDRPFIARVPLVGARGEFSQTDARWAKILEIKRTGRLAQILLEVHNADTPPYEHWTRTLVPRGRDPKVGDDVYWVDMTAPNSNHRAISIKWGREPNYGSPRPTNEDLEQAFLTPFMSNPVFDAGKAAAGDPDRQLEILEQRHADG